MGRPPWPPGFRRQLIAPRVPSRDNGNSRCWAPETCSVQGLSGQPRTSVRSGLEHIAPPYRLRPESDVWRSAVGTPAWKRWNNRPADRCHRPSFCDSPRGEAFLSARSPSAELSWRSGPRLREGRRVLQPWPSGRHVRFVVVVSVQAQAIPQDNLGGMARGR